MQVFRDTTREVRFTANVNPYAAGSVICEFGKTKVLITASIDESIPPWLKGKGEGWVTAEYNMLPSSTHERMRRERKGLGGRTQEIQRLIGRSLRSVVDLKKLGERQIIIDCDVLIADGGTRTCSITGAYVALAQAVNQLISQNKIKDNPILEPIAAISVGIDKQNEIRVDLNYEEDSSCLSDMNIVMTQSGKVIELQATAEDHPFDFEYLPLVWKLSKSALSPIFEAQKKVLGE